jgi:hypothetical protein
MDPSPVSKGHAWLVKDPTISHPNLGYDSGGLSLQDVRNYYLRHEDPSCFPLATEPWYLPGNESTTASLCERCRYLNFAWLLQNRTKSNHGPILFLRDMLSCRSECSFCGLAVFALRTANGARLTVEDLGDGDNVLCCWVSSEQTEFGSNTYILRLSLRRLFVTGGYLGFAGYIHQLSEDNLNLPGRRISPSCANFGLLRNWVRICEHNHDDFAERTRYDDLRSWKSNGYTLRVIDLQEKYVKVVGYDTRYVILSYVWGGAEQLLTLVSNYQHLSSKGGLVREEYQKRIPQTIHDAMYFVAQLGERYIWVDALCIIQDDPDKGEQIQNMDSIYNAAVWCLVAASAKDANSPLPRIRMAQNHLLDSQPNLQHTARVQQTELAAVLPSLAVTLGSSIWNTRAWTYQESVLSRRLLIISNDQMYFTCRHGHTFCEDTDFESTDKPATIGERDGHIYGMAGKTNFEVYAGAVEGYTSRNITYHEDALKAFTGVLSYLETAFRGTFLFGLPDTELDQALLWYPVSDQHRRQSSRGDDLFPSWSWAGWVGGVRYRSNLAISRVQWKHPFADGYFTSEEFRRPNPSTSDVLWYRQTWVEDNPKLPQSLWEYDTCYYEKGRPEQLYLHPVGVSTAWEKYNFSIDSQLLHFRALCCNLYVTGEHGHPFISTMTSCTNGKHELCALKILNKAGVIVGTVQIVASNASTLNPGSFEFIRLSRTRLTTDDTRHHVFQPGFDEYEEIDKRHETSESASDSDAEEIELGLEHDYVEFDITAFDVSIPWCIYNVMLIETSNGISRRVGLGRMHVDAFLREEPLWRDVILG